MFYWKGWTRVAPREYAEVDLVWTDQEDPDVDTPLEGVLAAMMLRADRVQLHDAEGPVGKFRDWRGRVTRHWTEPPIPAFMTLAQAEAIVKRVRTSEYQPSVAEEEILENIERTTIKPRYPYIRKAQGHFLEQLLGWAIGEPEGGGLLPLTEWRQLMQRLY